MAFYLELLKYHSFCKHLAISRRNHHSAFVYNDPLVWQEALQIFANHISLLVEHCSLIVTADKSFFDHSSGSNSDKSSVYSSLSMQSSSGYLITHRMKN